MLISDWSSDVCSSDLTYCTLGSRAASASAEPLSSSSSPQTTSDGTATRLISSSVESVKLSSSGFIASGSPLVVFRNCTAIHSGEPRGCSSIRSEEHTSELQSLMRISYAVFCLKKKKIIKTEQQYIIMTH